MSCIVHHGVAASHLLQRLNPLIKTQLLTLVVRGGSGADPEVDTAVLCSLWFLFGSCHLGKLGEKGKEQ